MDNSILEKLKEAASAEDLQSIAKKCGLDKITLDDAKKLFEQLKSKGSISMDSLMSVLGSAGSSKSGTKSGSSEASGALKGVLGAVEKAAKSGESKSTEGAAKTGSEDKTKEVKEAADALKDVLGKFKK